MINPGDIFQFGDYYSVLINNVDIEGVYYIYLTAPNGSNLKYSISKFRGDFDLFDKQSLITNIFSED